MNPIHYALTLVTCFLLSAQLSSAAGGGNMGGPAPANGSRRGPDLNEVYREGAELLGEYGREGEFVALIGAAEISRDVLSAPKLAAALFLAYATEATDAPWTGKALLASKELTSDPTERRWLDGRLDALPEDPFVRYARMAHQGSELGDLESRLQERLDALMARVEEELAARRLLAGVPEN